MHRKTAPPPLKRRRRNKSYADMPEGVVALRSPDECCACVLKRTDDWLRLVYLGGALEGRIAWRHIGAVSRGTPPPAEVLTPLSAAERADLSRELRTTPHTPPLVRLDGEECLKGSLLQLRKGWARIVVLMGTRSCRELRCRATRICRWSEGSDGRRRPTSVPSEHADDVTARGKKRRAERQALTDGLVAEMG